MRLFAKHNGSQYYLVAGVGDLQDQFTAHKSNFDLIQKMDIDAGLQVALF